MGNLLRRLRGALGMGLTWGAVSSAAGFVVSAMFGFNADAPFPLIFGVFGFLSGVIFSALLVLAEGRRGFEQLSMPRFAGWGALGGLVLAGFFARAVSFGWSDVLVIAPTFALASAIGAAGSLAVARRAVSQEPPGIGGGPALQGRDERRLP